MSSDGENEGNFEGLSLNGVGVQPSAANDDTTTGDRDPFEGLRPTVFRPPVDPTKPRPAVEKLKELLNCWLRVQIEDGRVFVGVFKCIDKECNIVLENTDEFRTESCSNDNAAENQEPLEAKSEQVDVLQRKLNLVMIPGRVIVHTELSEANNSNEQNANAEREDPQL